MTSGEMKLVEQEKVEKGLKSSQPRETDEGESAQSNFKMFR